MSTAALWVCTQRKRKTMMKAQKSAFVKSSEMRIMTGLIRWCLYNNQKRETKKLNGKKWKEEEEFWTFEIMDLFCSQKDQIVVCVRHTKFFY
jgi:hypothetical protein